MDDLVNLGSPNNRRSVGLLLSVYPINSLDLLMINMFAPITGESLVISSHISWSSSCWKKIKPKKKVKVKDNKVKLIDSLLVKKEEDKVENNLRGRK